MSAVIQAPSLSCPHRLDSCKRFFFHMIELSPTVPGRTDFCLCHFPETGNETNFDGAFECHPAGNHFSIIVVNNVWKLKEGLTIHHFS
mmetsp:Transcript_13391/g.27646  ORF Transcript_13391/g.27646 Transcript_13391/m.27646 type:complete len:88 (-) Transcript_13391:189-452(-)